MSQHRIVLIVVTAGLLTAAGAGLYQWGLLRGQTLAPAGEMAPPASSVAQAPLGDPSQWSIPQGEDATRRHLRDGIKAGDTDPQTGRRILYYHDPMMPSSRFDTPGPSPYMDMMLVPVYAGADQTDDSRVTISPRIQQNLGLRTARATEGRLQTVVSAVGTIAWNEREQVIVQARAMGYVEKVLVSATLDRVVSGQTLAELYVPEWVAVQEEFLALQRLGISAPPELLDAARARMRQAGMEADQIRQVEEMGSVTNRVMVRAPVGGAVTELAIREGMTVMPGATLVQINGLNTVWAQAEIPESQSARMVPGMPVSVTSPALPGVAFDGRVQALLPRVDPQTRTVTARLELNNPGGVLVPGMFVRMDLLGEPAPPAILVPSEALIHTGRRTLVLLASEGGFEPREVITGLEVEGRTEVLQGLRAGQEIILSGQFLIDSEASLRGIEARSFTAEMDTGRETDQGTHTGHRSDHAAQSLEEQPVGHLPEAGESVHGDHGNGGHP